MKHFLRSRYSNVVDRKTYEIAVLPMLKKDEDRMQRNCGGKYHYYYDVRPIDGFETIAGATKDLLLVNVYEYFEEAQ